MERRHDVRSQTYFCYARSLFRTCDYAGARRGTLQVDERCCSKKLFQLVIARAPDIIVLIKTNVDAVMPRSRRTTVEKLRIVATNGNRPIEAQSKLDPRLIDFVRLLARAAARDFVRSEQDNQKKGRLPE
jgi:hypothetical protein